MEKLYEDLKIFGFDKKEAMERFLDDGEFYVDCCLQVMQDSAFDELAEYMRTGDNDKAFDCAHSLKGVISNVELPKIAYTVSRIVEILRGSEDGDIEVYYKELIEQRDRCLELLEGR